MAYHLRLTKHPDRLNDKHYLIIEDWLELIKQGKQLCVNKMIDMCQDLYKNGMETRFKKHLFGPVYELKSRTALGGARVYFFVGENEAILVHAECKKEDRATTQLLNDVANVVMAYEGKSETKENMLNYKKEG